MDGPRQHPGIDKNKRDMMADWASWSVSKMANPCGGRWPSWKKMEKLPQLTFRRTREYACAAVSFDSFDAGRESSNETSSRGPLLGFDDFSGLRAGAGPARYAFSLHCTHRHTPARGRPSLDAACAMLHQAGTPLTRQEILDRWPYAATRPTANTLWRWLKRGRALGALVRHGDGIRGDAHRYGWPPRSRKGKWREGTNHRRHSSSSRKMLGKSRRPCRIRTTWIESASTR